MDYIVGDELYHLRNDDLLLIPPNIMHNPVFRDFDAPYERYVLWVSVNTVNRLLSVDDELALKNEEDFPKKSFYMIRQQQTPWGNYRTIFASLEQTILQKKAFFRAQTETFILLLLIEYRKAQVEGTSQSLKAVRDNLITHILHYINSRLTGDLSLDTISHDFLMDKFTFSHYFKEKMSVSYHRYVISQRLLVGKNLLLSGQAADSACYSCGFNDYSSFYRAFRKEYGVSPSQYKKLHEEFMQ